ncbi:DNA gyrase subunit B [Striga asiatica]|uniref:DNA gyrase subunit B n=1 Tax=Striga asiatica TaxID=4170 RepID=A0A5A7QXJ7_STRAF|nr:DNA gyrase subunit B [Striga asiatica]
MGSCISKCKPKKKSIEVLSPIHDKLIISQQQVPPKMTTMPFENPNPLPSHSCSTDASKFTATSSSMSSSSASSSYCSSSALIAKDRSFSNELLWSCVKENRHIIDLKKNISADKRDQRPTLMKTKQPSQEKAAASRVPTPKKRARANSPTLVRQKSFRKEQSLSSVPNRALRSPSPSRRFSKGENGGYISANGVYENGSHRRQAGTRRESFRASAASRLNRELAVEPNFWLAKKGTLVSRNIDDLEMDAVMEDINNPHIALDCFIFL